MVQQRPQMVNQILPIQKSHLHQYHTKKTIEKRVNEYSLKVPIESKTTDGMILNENHRILSQNVLSQTEAMVDLSVLNLQMVVVQMVK